MYSNNRIVIVSISICLLMSGCATATYKQKIVATGIAAGLVGGLVGSAVAPQGEKKIAHAMMWGGLGAATATIVATHVYQDRELKEKERQIEQIKKELAVARNEDVGTPENGRPAFEKDLPPEYRRLIQPGAWEIYKLDQWVKQGEGIMIHQDKMIKVTPPRFLGE